MTKQQGIQQLEEGEGALLLLGQADAVSCSTSCCVKGVPCLARQGKEALSK